MHVIFNHIDVCATAKAKEFLEAAGHLNVLNAYSVKHIHTALNGDGA